jgi:N-acetylmuramic acid 6-phosphate etherase
MSFDKLTEQPSLYDNLENKTVEEILHEINLEDQKVALAVQKTIPQIEKLVTGIIKNNLDLFY